ncbi:hypothetical protein AB0H34_23485 [Saccharopolyspora shandongensis]|uniref:hypothetical protein n=1 Tax=Saccharopolyspora shandongensis TaxID=418495 RepID=UPI0033C4A25C
MNNVFRNEFYRGTAGPLATAMLVSLVAVLFLQPWWAGSWNDLAVVLRTDLIFTWPLVATAGAWAAGRENRRGTEELLATVPRPSWQPFLVSWAALTLGAVLGIATAWGIAALFVLPIATGSSGDWIAVLLVCIPAHGSGAAFGMALGRLVRWRLIVLLTPALALLAYLAVSWANFVFGYDSLFTILAYAQVPDGAMHSLSSSALQAMWFAAIAATFLALAVSRPRWLVLVPMALVAALTLLFASTPLKQHIVADPVAMREVCTTRGPKICVARHEEHVLDQLAEFGQPMLEKLGGIPGAPEEVRFRSATHPDGPSYLHNTTVTGRLADPVRERDWLAGMLVGTVPTCDGESFYRAFRVARAWLVDDEEGATRLLGNGRVPDREWMTAYYAARVDCDIDAALALLN